MMLPDSPKSQKAKVWHYSHEFELVETAHDWDIDPDQWELLSVRARGIMLQYTRSKHVMELWENRELRRKYASRR